MLFSKRTRRSAPFPLIEIWQHRAQYTAISSRFLIAKSTERWYWRDRQSGKPVERLGLLDSRAPPSPRIESDRGSIPAAGISTRQAVHTSAYITGQQSPLKERFGGWYVTGAYGAKPTWAT